MFMKPSVEYFAFVVDRDGIHPSPRKVQAIQEVPDHITHYDPKKPVRLAVDASSFGLGAVMSHVSEDGEDKPIAFASRTLSSSEQNYSMIEKEALAIIKSLARLHVWWPNLDSDIEQTVRDCSDCQANRCRAPLNVSNPWIWPTRPWQRVHVDFAGPFNGGMFLIVVDAKSKWMEVIQMSSTSASATIRALRRMAYWKR